MRRIWLRTVHPSTAAVHVIVYACAARVRPSRLRRRFPRGEVDQVDRPARESISPMFAATAVSRRLETQRTQQAYARPYTRERLRGSGGRAVLLSVARGVRVGLTIRASARISHKRGAVGKLFACAPAGTVSSARQHRIACCRGAGMINWYSVPEFMPEFMCPRIYPRIYRNSCPGNSCVPGILVSPELSCPRNYLPEL
jgi:hypothetical protein